jgi:DNA-binding Xre family transcriptional regulator
MDIEPKNPLSAYFKRLNKLDKSSQIDNLTKHVGVSEAAINGYLIAANLTHVKLSRLILICEFLTQNGHNCTVNDFAYAEEGVEV